MPLRSTLRDGLTLTTFQQLDLGCKILKDEAAAIEQLASQLDSDFCNACQLILNCNGSVIVTGMGKAGLIGRKITATLASTGTRSHFLHPAEALHGDLGEVGEDDVIIVLSHSGETDEIIRLLPSFQRQTVIAITGKPASSLAKAADVVLCIGKIQEAGSLKLAPTTSTTAMLALGDALALVVSQNRGFQAVDFARLHPAGSLGRKLATVDDIMRPLARCRVASETRTVREVLVSLKHTGRRTGAILLTNDGGQLTGIFTDSDLARLFESQRDSSLDGAIRDVMTKSPQMMQSGQRMSTAMDLIVDRKISELPIVDNDLVPVGMIDITDIVAFLPNDHADHLASPTEGTTMKEQSGSIDETNQIAKSA